MTEKNSLSFFVDPLTRAPLSVRAEGLSNGKHIYPLVHGIPDLIAPKPLPPHDQKAKEFYAGRGEQYENTIHLTFFTFNEDETAVRNSFIDKLHLNTKSKVLEIACGTGRDSELIANRLGEHGELHMQDISEDMISLCYQKLNNAPFKKSFCLSNAAHLPYPDHSFDATYSFGAMGEFSDKKQVLREMIRVTKPGGRIVFGDESIPVWLRSTDFYKILQTTNYMYAETVPFEAMPVEARNVNVSWVIGGTFYLVDFTVGVGEPEANFDYFIPGVRGGTYRTRYEGQLEGVTPEIKKAAWEYVKNNKLNMHEWLTDVVSKAIKENKAT